MKLKNYVSILALIFTITLFTACSDDENLDENKNSIIVENDVFEVDPGANFTVSITSGSGNYTVMTTDDEIIEASVEGNSVSITAKKSGKAHVIVTDDEGMNAFIGVLVYKDIAVTTTLAEITYLTGSKTIEITSGNGGFYVKSSNEDIVGARIESNTTGVFLRIEGKKVEELTYKEETVTLYDRTGRSVEIAVTPSKALMDDTPRMEYAGIRKEVGDENVVFRNRNSSSFEGSRQFEWKENNDDTKKLTFYIPKIYDLTKTGSLHKNSSSKLSAINVNLTGYNVNIKKYVYVNAVEVLKYDANKDLVWIRYISGQQEGIICMKYTI